MRVLILGGGGMLGHQLFKRLHVDHDTRVTLWRDVSAYAEFGLFTNKDAYPLLDVRDRDRMFDAFSDFHPAAVINAVGAVRQRAAVKIDVADLEINALFPHRIANLCRVMGSRLIHVSTDCVFSGMTGNYTEDDLPDPDDIYGRSKLLGEVSEDHCITLRTSIIGTQLFHKKSLLEWFLAQSGQIKGFNRAIFSGFTTFELSHVIERLLVEYPNASGIYHVSSQPISKFDLLMLIKAALNLPIEIVPDGSVICDRSLDSTRFREKFGYEPPTWEMMIEELANDIRAGQQDHV